ncbi:PREDICTED: hydrocephalus-inducing protein-like [Poecilia mexicana]|uniref:hydrocephalus-inducing protein-like n=1 Tax=Poecilia mexicana TaxID=48701 RepID=UPI00072E1C5E|nr:PREDICTED: hydrocephalus-inducing protein-like [Poecilia mexicana]
MAYGSEVKVDVRFEPHQLGEVRGQLTLNSDIGGEYIFPLHGVCTFPRPQGPYNIKGGGSVSIPFKNVFPKTTAFSLKSDHPDFIVDKNVSVLPGFPSGSEVKVDVRFEPHQLGAVRGQLTLNSDIGGEYIFPLHGVCTFPRPRGPYNIKGGGSVSIPFKNVFPKTTAFSLKVDNPCFNVKEMENIPPKKSHNIMVSFEVPSGGHPGPWFGKLTVCRQNPEARSNAISWVFYLKGQRPQSS